MNGQNLKLDAGTAVLTDLIRKTDLSGRLDLIQQAGNAFIDYLAALLAARNEPKVVRTAELIAERPGMVPLLGQAFASSPENAAFFNGFCSHYLDFDDAQSNLAGHFSTVIFSALLALTQPEDTLIDLFTAYAAGTEIEGILGGQLNPRHKRQGWHPTGTVGPVGAAAAIARYRKLDREETAALLSMAATQSSGMGFEAGSDTKPLHSGFASRNAVFSYLLIKKAGLSARLIPFNNNTGWMKTISGKKLNAGEAKAQWLNPGQILQPGLWMKEHPYCSAGICGAAACRALYRRGYHMEDLSKVFFHFPPGADYSLHYMRPRTGQEGRFSMEYVAWQIFRYGDVEDHFFQMDQVPEEFLSNISHFKRLNDLPVIEKSKREIKVTIVTKSGKKAEENIKNPPGSPDHPFTKKDLIKKLSAAVSEEEAESIWSFTQKISSPAIQIFEVLSNFQSQQLMLNGEHHNL